MAALGKLGNYKNFGLLIIRVGLGIMFIYHGYPKLLGGQKMWEQLGESTKYVGIHFMPMIWGLLCAVVETVGGVLLIIGFWFRPACIFLLLNLLVAAISQFHNGGLEAAAHPIEDAITFAGLIFLGPGKFSVDKK